MLRIWTAAVLAFAATAAFAQTSAPISNVVQRVDPVLVVDPATLKPDQIAGMQQKLNDWPGLHRYRDENAKLPPSQPGRVVFFGDSITDMWGSSKGTVFFPGKPYVNRGIGGQTTPQLVLRFQQDVVSLHPAAVVILGGINDFAGNTGLMTLEMTKDNFRSMVAIAQANRIRVILASVLPADHFAWRKGLEPAAEIAKLNTWMKQFAAEQHCTYLDYYSALVDTHGGMKPGTSLDGVHPSPAGYAIMAPLAQAAIDQALDVQQGVPVQR